MHQRRDVVPACGKPLTGRQPVDRPLRHEDGIDLAHRLERHRRDRDPPLVARLRRELPNRFPQLQFFFQPADIVNQVLNFGRAAPIDIRISSFDDEAAYAVAAKIARERNIEGGKVGDRSARRLEPFAKLRHLRLDVAERHGRVRLERR